MKISDKAEDTPDIELARQSAPGAYVLDGEELSPADDLTEEGQFPEYGDFLPVHRARATEDGWEPTGDEMWIECPQDLAQFLVEQEVEPQDGFRIKDVKKVDGTWQYNCEILE